MDLAFGVVLTSAMLVLVLEVIRTRRPGAPWWRVVLEVKSRNEEWPLYGAALLLILIAGASSHRNGLLLLAPPVWVYLAWYLRRWPGEMRHRRQVLPDVNGEAVDEPSSNVRRVD